MNSPFITGAQCRPIAVEDTFRFRGKMVTVVRHGWQCEATGREFSTATQEDQLLGELEQAWLERRNAKT